MSGDSQVNSDTVVLDEGETAKSAEEVKYDDLFEYEEN